MKFISLVAQNKKNKKKLLLGFYKMKAYAIALIARGSVIGSVIVLCCLCKMVGCKRKQTTRPASKVIECNHYFSSPTSSSWCRKRSKYYQEQWKWNQRWWDGLLGRSWRLWWRLIKAFGMFIYIWSIYINCCFSLNSFFLCHLICLLECVDIVNE